MLLAIIYMVAIDHPNLPVQAQMARLFASSLVRTQFTGKIIILHNQPCMLFKAAPANIVEISINAPYTSWADSMAWKYRVADLIDTTGYDKVMFCDADCIALRNMDHLLEGDFDLYYQPERESITHPYHSCFLTDEEMLRLKARKGANGGTLAVRASIFHEVMKEWQRIDEGAAKRKRLGSDQAAWNRLLLDTALRKRPFERGEIMFPLMHDKHFPEYRQAALLHAAGGELLAEAKLSFLWGMYAQTFLGSLREAFDT